MTIYAAAVRFLQKTCVKMVQVPPVWGELRAPSFLASDNVYRDLYSDLWIVLGYRCKRGSEFSEQIVQPFLSVKAPGFF